MSYPYGKGRFAPDTPPMPDTPTPQLKERTPRLPYLPGLDGLRAVAVIAVLLYHAEISWIPGGFLGVEVFFVISGYLITALLLSEWRSKGQINLKAFWLGRARRLLPALFLLLAATLTFAIIFLPREVAGLRGDVLAAFGYVTNWYLIFNNKSYFEAVGRPSILQHLWSLAVEEQFYLLWPLLLSALLRRWKPRIVLLAILGGVVASAGLMALLYQPNIDPSRIYYGTDTRAAGLLIGAALAFVWLPRRDVVWAGRVSQLTSVMLNLAGFAALAVILWFFLRLDQYQAFLYQGGFLLLALCTAVLIAVIVHPLAHLGPGLLGWRPLRWVGLRSYGIYLWHWPIFMLTRPQLDVPLEGLPLLVMRLALTLGLAELSYRYVEVQVRGGVLGRAWKELRQAQGLARSRLTLRWVGAGGTLAAFCLIVGAVAAGAQPPPPPSYLAALATPSALFTVQAAVTSNALPSAAIPQTTPAINTASAQNSAVPAATTKATTIAAPHILAIGDSVMLSSAAQLRKTFDNIEIDATISRHFPDVIDLLKAKRAAGQIGEIVIIHLGSNGGFDDKHFDQMMDFLKDVKRVLIVNNKVPRFWETPNNQVLARGVKRYPNTVMVDWRAATINRPTLFWDDGIHPRPEGIQLYVDLIAAPLKGT